MDYENPKGEIIPDRRRASRIRYEAKAIFAFAGKTYAAITQDLTPEGVFICSNLGAPVDTPVELTLDLHDGEEPIDVRGRVVRVASGPPLGFAVEFHNIEADQASRIRNIADL